MVSRRSAKLAFCMRGMKSPKKKTLKNALRKKKLLLKNPVIDCTSSDFHRAIAAVDQLKNYVAKKKI